MSLEQLLNMLGVTTVAEAMTAINRFNMLVEGVMGETEADSAAEALNKLKSIRGCMASIEAAVGAKGPEALAKVEAFKAQAARSSDLEQQLNAVHKQSEKKTAEEKIGAAISEGRLPPAMRAKAEELYQQNGLTVLDSFLAAFTQPLFKQPNNAPRNEGGGGVKQPKVNDQPSGDEEFTEEEREVMRIMNRTPEQMRTARKLWNESLHKDNKTAIVPESHVRGLNTKIERGART